MPNDGTRTKSNTHGVRKRCRRSCERCVVTHLLCSGQQAVGVGCGHLLAAAHPRGLRAHRVHLVCTSLTPRRGEALHSARKTRWWRHATRATHLEQARRQVCLFVHQRRHSCRQRRVHERSAAAQRKHTQEPVDRSAHRRYPLATARGRKGEGGSRPRYAARTSHPFLPCGTWTRPTRPS